MPDIEYILFFVAVALLASGYSVRQMFKARSIEQNKIRQNKNDEQAVLEILFPKPARSSVHAYVGQFIVDLISEGFLPINAPVDELYIIATHDDHIVVELITDSKKYTITVTGDSLEFNETSLLDFLKTNGIINDSLLSNN